MIVIELVFISVIAHTHVNDIVQLVVSPVDGASFRQVEQFRKMNCRADSSAKVVSFVLLLLLPE